MSFGFGTDFVINGKIKESLKKEFTGKFTDKELDLAANKFCNAGRSDDVEALKNEATKKAKAIEIFNRIQPKNEAEIALVNKINEAYGIA